MVTAKQALEFGSRQLDGILGSDALTRDFTIDYSRRRFDWSVGTVTWADERAVVVPRPPGYAQAIDGVMPLHRFASVSVRRTESAVILRHR